MKNKLLFISGIAAGYVLGARAGRSSYEQLKVKAREVWDNPKVQERVTGATETVKARAPEVQERATEAARKAQETVSGAVKRGKNGNGSDGAGAGSGSVNSGGGAGSTGRAAGGSATVSEAGNEDNNNTGGRA